jgi:hypothetical protein
MLHTGECTYIPGRITKLNPRLTTRPDTAGSHNSFGSAVETQDIKQSQATSQPTSSTLDSLFWISYSGRGRGRTIGYNKQEVNQKVHKLPQGH